VIFWHISKGGKKYPCDSDNRRDFHKCDGTAKPQPAPANQAAAGPSPQPASPANHIERRLQWLESEVRGLLIRMDALGS
jgi:hypothetical protein